jgi:hypothetical protein
MLPKIWRGISKNSQENLEGEHQRAASLSSGAGMMMPIQPIQVPNLKYRND